MKIDFSFDTPYGIFRDALYLADGHTFTEEEIQALKEQRRDNWIAVITAPSQEPPLEPAQIGDAEPQEVTEHGQ